MQAHDRSLRFLGTSNKLSVPFFQRHYVWEESNWKELVESLESEDTIPFLGSLILKEQTGNEFTIIDGQQRLTTITILTKAIYDSLPEDNRSPGSGVRNGVENFLFYRVNSADDFKDSHVKIEHSRIDNVDYSRIIRMNLLDDNKIDLDTINKNSSNILKCYKYYMERFASYTPKDLKTLFNLIFDENRKVIIEIKLEKNDVNEQTIFDTINRAGVRLNAAEIIKNNLFKKLLDKSGNDELLKDRAIGIYNSCWDSVFNKSKEVCEIWDEERIFGNVRHNNLEFLLYCVACVKWGEDSDMFSKLEAVYNRETTNMEYSDLIELIKEIKEYACIFEKYILNFKKELEDENSNLYFKYNENVNRLLLILQKFKVQMFYPYVLKRLYDVEQDTSNPELIEDFKKLESFVVRRKLSNKGTHDYTSKCYSIIKNGIDDLVKSDLSNPDSGISNYDISKYLLDTKDDTAKMILFCMELYKRKDDGVDVNVLEYKYTLEHIMPRKWEKHWSDVPIVDDGVTYSTDSLEGQAIRNNAIQALGNKTLLTCNLNSAIRNGSYEQKINGDGDKKPGYKSHTMLLLTKEIYETWDTDKVWDEKHIKDRTQKLYKEFLVLWPDFSDCLPAITVDPPVTSDDPDLSVYTEKQLADPIELLGALS